VEASGFNGFPPKRLGWAGGGDSAGAALFAAWAVSAHPALGTSLYKSARWPLSSLPRRSLKTGDSMSDDVLESVRKTVQESLLPQVKGQWDSDG
jgi:hypothetical protein